MSDYFIKEENGKLTIVRKDAGQMIAGTWDRKIKTTVLTVE